MKRILVTGGAGYIGSHTCVELLAAGHEVIVVDNLANSRRSVLARVARIAGKAPIFVEADVREACALDAVFRDHAIDAVVHFAGVKAVGESVQKPLLYYDINVAGTLALIGAMTRAGVRRIVFSSSCTVYGDAGQPPFTEDSPLGPTNPYGRSKLMAEQVLSDLAASRPEWSVVLLRYFNPIGAHPSGIIGEDPNGIPNCLLPYVSQVAIGKLDQLSVLGNDYPTHDGTGVRDYIHVVDLAAGHVSALDAVLRQTGVAIFNLGAGRGYSVLEVLQAFERESGRSIPHRIAPRRPGDVAESYSDPSKAIRDLGWRAVRDLDTMCRDAWRWQQWHAAHEAEL